MAQYNTGTVDTLATSNIISGNNTGWIDSVNMSNGDEIRVGEDEAVYTISNVDTANQELTLTANYPTTQSTVSYVATQDFTTLHNLPKPSGSGELHLWTLIARAFTMIDGLLQKSQVEAGDTGEYLEDKITAGAGITITKAGSPVDLTIAAADRQAFLFLSAGGAICLNCHKETIESVAGPALRVVRMDNTDGSPVPQMQWNFTMPDEYNGGTVNVTLFITLENDLFVEGDTWRFDIKTACWSATDQNPLEQAITTIADQDVTTDDPTSTGATGDIHTELLSGLELALTAGRLVNLEVMFDTANSDYSYADVIGVLVEFTTQSS